MSTNVGGMYSEKIPNLQLAWDSTCLSVLKECPRKYQYSILMGYQPKSISIHLTFGLLVHSCLEFYDKLVAQGATHEMALEQATFKALTDSVVRSVAEDGTPTWAPFESDYPQKTRMTLVRTIVWYLDKFGNTDPATTMILADGKPAVELSFRFATEFKVSTGEKVLLCGHLDRVVHYAGAVYFMDRKTTKNTLSGRTFSAYSPDNQMSLYSIAGKVVFGLDLAGGLIDAIQLMVEASRFARGFVNRTPGQLDEWYADLQFWISIAEACAIADNWPMNDASCGNYGGCKYREICSKDPSVRHAFLESNFIVKKWNPLEVR